MWNMIFYIILRTLWENQNYLISKMRFIEGLAKPLQSQYMRALFSFMFRCSLFLSVSFFFLPKPSSGDCFPYIFLSLRFFAEVFLFVLVVVLVFVVFVFCSFVLFFTHQPGRTLTLLGQTWNWEFSGQLVLPFQSILNQQQMYLKGQWNLTTALFKFLPWLPRVRT